MIRMRLLCPHCGKAHIIRDGALGPAGRTVRCSSCKSTWFADATGTAKTPAHAYEHADPHALIERVRKATAYKPLKSKKPGATASNTRRVVEPGLAILGALALLLGAGLIFREPVVKTTPSLATLYKGIGLPVNVRGLEFAEVKSSRSIKNGEQVLVVEGRIANVSGAEVSVPAIRVTLRSPTGGEIDAVSVRPEQGKLGLTGETTFKTQFANPSTDAKDVLVHFSNPQNLGS
jgi:predicted Zn finger-like uncharacterized protein